MMAGRHPTLAARCVQTTADRCSPFLIWANLCMPTKGDVRRSCPILVIHNVQAKGDIRVNVQRLLSNIQARGARLKLNSMSAIYFAGQR